jgi:uncharacterized delta-60 repeat protein
MKQTLIILSFLFFPASMDAQVSGTLDASFGVNGKVTTAFFKGQDAAKAIVIQSDGKIIAAGISSKTQNSNGQMALARYNTDGTLDNSFGTNGKVTTAFGLYSEIHAMTLQADGKIIAVGESSDSSRTSFAMVRYNSTGALDTSFGTNGKVMTAFETVSSATAVTLQSDNKIVVAGATFISGFINPNGVVALARYSMTGKLDTSFNATGKFITDINPLEKDVVSSVAVQADNKIVIAGISRPFETDGCTVPDPPDLFVIRCNATGSLDTSFASNGLYFQEGAEASTVKVLNSGKILVAGNINYLTNDFILFRLNTNGVIDATFNFDAPTRGRATDMLVQKNGQILLVGWTYNDGSEDVNFTLMRCNSEGILDNTFGTNGKVITPPVFMFERYNKIALQNDGKIVACGRSRSNFIGDLKFNFNVIRYNNTIERVGTKAVATEKECLAIYPNPTSGALTIDIKNLAVGDASVRIIDRVGRIVWQNKFSHIQAPLQLTINDLITGLYVVEVTSADKHWSQLITKY